MHFIYYLYFVYVITYLSIEGVYKMLKRRSRILLTLLLTCGLVLPQGTAIAADRGNAIKLDESTIELIEMFPEYKESLQKDTTGDLVGNSEVYIKMKPKDDLKDESLNNKSSRINENSIMTTDEITENFEIECYSKEEFDSKYKKYVDKMPKTSTSRSKVEDMVIQRSSGGSSDGGTVGIGPLEVNSCSWLRLDLQVYNGSGSSDYMAYNFCSWLTRPVFRFTDAIGISTTSGLIISSDTTVRSALYRYPSPFVPTGAGTSLTVTNQGNGVIAKVPLIPISVYNTYPNLKEYNNMMIQTGISFSGTSTKQGWIQGNYLHKQVAIGGIGMDVNGVPSLSIGGSTDTHSGMIHVQR